jgi:hypothetical protein
MEENNDRLAPPAVSQLRAEAGGQMERSLSADIREEREDLREAAEQTLNVIMDLSLDGTIRWVSPSWTDVIGTTLESVQGTPIKDLLVSDNKEVFAEIVESMLKDDSRSQLVRFTVQLGPASKLATVEIPDRLEPQGEDAPMATEEPLTIDLEGQGIMVYDRSSGGESHVSWNFYALDYLANGIADNVDDSTLDCPTRDSNRPTSSHRRIARLWSRGPSQLPYKSRRGWFGGSAAPCTTSTGSVPDLRAPDSTVVV